MRRRLRYLFALAMIAACATVACSRNEMPGNQKAAPADAWSGQSRVPGEYLITVAAGAGAKAITDLYGRFGIKGTKDLGNNVYLVTLGEDPGPETMEKLKRGNAHIKAVQPNYVYRTQ